MLELMRDFSEAALNTWYCDERAEPPTHFHNRALMANLSTNACTVTGGQGNKTIVVFGNSHARFVLLHLPSLIVACRNYMPVSKKKDVFYCRV